MTNDAPKHARFGASKADIWLNCSGALALMASLPPAPPSRYGEEGTRAHTLAEYCLNHGIWDAFEVALNPAEHRFDGGPTEDEMIGAATAVNVYLDTIASVMATDPGARLYVEKRVVFSNAHPDDCWGTSDAIIVLPNRKRIVVIDYKHGVGKRVYVVGNVQMLSYALGSVLDPDIDTDGVEDVELIVVQPRARDATEDEKVQRWPIKMLDLIDFAHRVDRAVALAKAQDPSFVAGDHCYWCTGKGACRAYAEANTAELSAIAPPMTLEGITQGLVPKAMAVLPEVSSLTPEQKAKVLAIADGIKAWLDAVHESAFVDLLNGIAVPGKKLVDKVGRRKWVGDPQTIASYLEVVYGLDPDKVTPRKLASISEVEALLKAALKDPSLFKEAKDDLTVGFMGKESSGLTMVDESDRREAASPITAASMLAGVKV
jgi:hypothetical protein